MKINTMVNSYISGIFIGVITIFNPQGLVGQPDRQVTETEPVSMQSMADPQLNGYIQTAVENNSQIQSQYHQWQSEVKKITAARILPDPRIRAGYFSEKMNMPGIPWEEWRVGFSQMLPWPGKLIVQGQMQSAMADAAYQTLRDATADVVFELKSIYYDTYFLKRNITITKQNLALIRQWEQVILSKYRTAMAGHADLINTEMETIELEDQLRTLEAQKAPLIARFSALLGNPVNDIVVPDSISPMPDSMDRETWQSRILDGNPELLKMQYMERSAGKSLTMAKLDWVPDLELGADYMRMGIPEKPIGMAGNMNAVMVMGSINIPLWGAKQAAQVKTARFKQIESETGVENVRNRLSAELETAWFDLTEAERKVNLYRERLIPLSVESLRASEKAYIGDEVEFLSLVDAERRLLMYQLEFENNSVRYLKAVARLEKLTGRSQ